MKKTFTAIAVASLLLIAPVSSTFAQTAADAKPAAKPVAKKTVKKVVKKKKEVHPKAAPQTSTGSGKKIALSEDNDDESSEPEIAGTKIYQFNCELGDKITAYKNEGDEKFVAIRWKNQIYRLRRVATTTGANRFENHLAGLVWIGIPAKSMLLDSKKGQQLANECKLVADASASPKG
ncbi:MAG: hypothetical protein JWP38_73 [Herbaspirillum sp.]|jgi:hypothetical protein|nr:hypothetical protein [Herbaspirillum sp.]